MENINKKRRKSTMISNKQDKVSQTSAEKIAGNEDLLREILLRLPVRSLIRFKCVSKPWLLLITDTRFSLAHSSRNFHSLSVSGFLFPKSTSKFDYFGLAGARSRFPLSLKFMEKSHVRIIQSCNGLMLCSTFKPRENYYVCNPTTKKFSSLPPPPLADHEFLCEFGINLVFDPSRSPHFKIVYFASVMEQHNRLSPDPFTCSTHVYSSNSQSWSSIESPERESLHSALDNGVLCNGSLYWLWFDEWKLICFDVDEQRFNTVTMNVDINLIGRRGKDDSVCLWQCKGKLYLVQEVVVSNALPDMVVYQMGNVCSEWLIKYMVKFSDVVLGLDTYDYVDGDEDEPFFCSYTILAAFGGQKDDDDIRLLLKLESYICESYVMLYGIKEKTTTKMLFSGYNKRAEPYIESFESSNLS